MIEKWFGGGMVKLIGRFGTGLTMEFVGGTKR